jgi:DNA-binding NarL/FixJ family response regulator
VKAVKTGEDPRTRIAVLLVHEHQLLAEALAIVLEADPALEVVGALANPDVVAAQVRRRGPDVALVTHLPPRLDGACLTAALRAEFADLKVVMLTAAADEDTLSACIQAGAVGCVTMDRPPAEVVRAVKRAHAGETLFASDVLLNLLTRPPDPGREPELQPPTQPLAPRELEVLQAVATGLSTEEAAARLGISVHTVRTHLKRALGKLGVRSKLEAVLVALKGGLIELSE